MLEVLSWLVILALATGAAYAGWLFFQGRLGDFSPAKGIFGPRPERRLDIVEQSNLDGRRRLVLIRRDDIEHLIMTGGPVDVVIENNIQRTGGRESGDAAPRAGGQNFQTLDGRDSATGAP